MACGELYTTTKLIGTTVTSVSDVNDGFFPTIVSAKLELSEIGQSTFSLNMAYLRPGTNYPAYVHTLPCPTGSVTLPGPRYKQSHVCANNMASSACSDAPENEVWIGVHADADGVGSTSVMIPSVARASARSLVIMSCPGSASIDLLNTSAPCGEPHTPVVLMCLDYDSESEFVNVADTSIAMSTVNTALFGEPTATVVQAVKQDKVTVPPTTADAIPTTPSPPSTTSTSPPEDRIDDGVASTCPSFESTQGSLISMTTIGDNCCLPVANAIKWTTPTKESHSSPLVIITAVALFVGLATLSVYTVLRGTGSKADDTFEYMTPEPIFHGSSRYGSNITPAKASFKYATPEPTLRPAGYGSNITPSQMESFEVNSLTSTPHKSPFKGHNHL
jgi:hypothetical protein